ncbi:MAG: hypothetical protein ACYTGX_04010 [Planctomycetota bacterium]
MSAVGAPADSPTQPPLALPLRLLLGVVAAVAVVAWVRAAWGVTVGEVSLPLLYAAAALACTVAAVRCRAPAVPAACVVLLATVAVADGLDPGRRPPPGGTGTLSDPDGVLWMRLPPGWVENTAARVHKEGYFVRKWVPAIEDPTAVAQLEVQVLRTTNVSWDALRQTPGVVEERAIQRGPATGYAWRIERHGEGQTGIELHYGGRRVFVRFKAGLGRRGSLQGFEQLRPQMEEILDSVTVVPDGWFSALDRRLFGG